MMYSTAHAVHCTIKFLSHCKHVTVLYHIALYHFTPQLALCAAAAVCMMYDGSFCILYPPKRKEMRWVSLSVYRIKRKERRFLSSFSFSELKVQIPPNSCSKNKIKFIFVFPTDARYTKTWKFFKISKSGLFELKVSCAVQLKSTCCALCCVLCVLLSVCGLGEIFVDAYDTPMTPLSPMM
jgi:hypothetical protein